MPESRKRKIVLASVLKPVNDVRMAEKLGVSLLKAGEFEVHVIGFPGPGQPVSGLVSHPLPFFKRLSLGRILVRLHVARKAIALRPALFIVTTHELLGIAILVKFLSGAKVIYDVQENYYRNILYLSTFHRLIRPVLALGVRLKEKVTSLFVNHFFLAEKEYANEFSFHAGRYTILENKAKKVDQGSLSARDPYKLLFSGTLSESTGVFKAIEIGVLLHQLDKRISLTLIGYCPQKKTLHNIRQAIAGMPFIQLIGGDELVPHYRITKEILSSGAGIIAYPYNPANHNSIPTKLYEYLAYRLPILLPYQGTWFTMCKPYNAAVLYGWNSINDRRILDALLRRQFYTSTPQDIFWDDEERKLLEVVKGLIG